MRLLNNLTGHKLGSLVMNDMRRQQFVFVKNQLKLVDVDDMGLEEPACRKNDDCRRKFFQETNFSNNGSLNISCNGGFCKGRFL